MDDAETEQFIPANNLLAYDVADRYEEEGNIETAEAVRNYIAERARRNGMANEIATEALHNRDKRFAEVDAITNDDGNIYSITLGNGVKGYVVGKSRVITRDDGSIDTAATAEANEGGYIYVNVDGVVKPKSVDDFVYLDGVESAADAKAAREAEINAALNAQYEELTAPVETQEATPASTEVAPESAAPAETAAAPVNNTPIVSNEVAENAARALGVLPEELEEVILDEQEGLERAARYNNIGDTESADAIRAYVAERFGTPAVQPAQVNNTTATEVGNNVADKREQSTSSLDAMPSESNLGEVNGAENIPAEQAPEAPVLSPEQQRKAKRAEIAKRIPTKGKNKLWTQAKAEDVAEYIATLTDDAAVQQATADKYIADIKEKQAKMDAIEALELNDDIAFWESVKGLLAPVETQAEEGATAQAPEVIPAAENEMQPVAEVIEQPLSEVQSEEAGEPVGNSEQLNQSEDNLEMGARLINEVSKEKTIGRSLSEQEAQSLIVEMENNAEVAPDIELNIDNWDALFGEDGTVTTPIGEVKMGENQFTKLMRQDRNGKLGMIKPTLENPDAIIEDKSKAKEGDTTERASSYIFVKAFNKADGTRYYYFTSVTVSKDSKEVVISNVSS